MSRANIWFIINGIAVTPGQYNLNGITKNNIIKSIHGKIEYKQKDIHCNEIEEASEAFMSST